MLLALPLQPLFHNSSHVFGCYLFYLVKDNYKIRKEYLLFDKNIMKKILGLGFTPFFMSSTEGILQVAFNRQLLLYGGDLSVSAMTILLSMSQILSLPMEGIAQGAQPIISYNFGAKI